MPQGQWRREYVRSLFGPEDEIELVSEEELAAKKALEEKRKRFFTYGMVGVGVGAMVTGTMTALAFNAFRRSDSAVTPAIYTALGSAAVGTAMVWLLSRAVGGEETDPRMAAMAVGARLSV